MNILLISYDYPPYKGGIANVSYQVACQLHNRGDRIFILAPGMKGDREFDKDNKFQTYRCINIFFLREVVLFLTLSHLAMRHKIDIAYNMMWCQGGFAAFLISRIFNIPYVLCFVN